MIAKRCASAPAGSVPIRRESSAAMLSLRPSTWRCAQAQDEEMSRMASARCQPIHRLTLSAAKASRRRTQVGLAARCRWPSHVEAEVQDVAVLNHVIGAFEPQLAGFLGALLAAMGDEIGIGDGLGADEALLEIAVDDARRLRRLGAL